MTCETLSPRPPRVVALVRALRGLGDFMCAVPAWRALRRAWPDARLVLLGLPEVRPLVDRFDHLLDELVEFPGWPGIPEVAFHPGPVARFLSEAQGQFDLAVQMHGSGRHINAFVALLGARRTGGFFLPGDARLDEERSLPYPEGEHEVVRNILLAERLGATSAGTELEFPVTKEDRAEVERLGEPALAAGPVAVVHPGAFAPARRWPAERFAAVADDLAADGVAIAISATPAEAEVAARVRTAMRAPSVDLTGRLSLGGLAALLERTRLLVANDTGVAHLAAAVGTPSVVIFSASDPARWAPLDRRRHRSLGRPAVLAAHGEGGTAPPVVGVEEAVAAARSLISAEDSDAAA